jgi:hypothetical protein
MYNFGMCCGVVLLCLWLVFIVALKFELGEEFFLLITFVSYSLIAVFWFNFIRRL